MGSVSSGPSWSVGRSQLRDRADGPPMARWVSGTSMLAAIASAAATHAAFWQHAHGGWTPGDGVRASAFACTLVLLLCAHEAGHVAAARAHGIELGWPVFVPVPLWFGTFGAILRWPPHPVPPQTRFSIAAAGPAAGFSATALASGLAPGLPQAASGTPPVLVGPSWLSGWLISPDPLDPSDPVRFACWVFLWVSSVNLLPFGELDGGHVMQALAPGWHRWASWATIGTLLAFGVTWPGWWLWGGAMVAIARSRSLGPPRTGSAGGARWVVALALWTIAASAWITVPFRF